MPYPTEYRAPDTSKVVPILGTLREGKVTEEVTPDPYPVAYQVTRKY
jgi:hypothetical protein